jgi:hypothetical protein
MEPTPKCGNGSRLVRTLPDTEVANIEDEHYKYGVPLLTDLKLSDNKMV